MSEVAPILVADSVVAGYDERDVLHGVTLALHSGEFLGVIGPNGSGKSTLIRTLTGLLPIRSGHVYFAGEDVAGISTRALARRLAVVPAVSVPTFAFSVREVVAMGRHPHLGRFANPRAADNQAIEEALVMTDVVHLADRAIDTLSSGELQRVVIARALAQRPEVLLLDEPTAHLDIGHQMATFELLVTLSRQQGLAILCISHDLNLAAEYCSRVALFSVGQVFAIGSPHEVVTEKNLRVVYGTLVSVEDNPYSGQPVVLLNRASPPQEELL